MKNPSVLLVEDNEDDQVLVHKIRLKNISTPYGCPSQSTVDTKRPIPHEYSRNSPVYVCYCSTRRGYRSRHRFTPTH